MEQNDFKLSRRGFIASAGLLTGALVKLPSWAYALEKREGPVTMIIAEAAKSPITVQKLRGGLTMLSGSGGNVILLAGKKGNLMVDAGINVSEKKMKAAIAGINPAPIKKLINTHWHFDHASGNEWVHQAGAQIIAHENTKKRLSQKITVEDWQYTFPPSPAGALPEVIFKQSHHVVFEGTGIHLNYYAPAHTDCDISVFFADADVLHVGDTLWNGYYPFIDYNTGGSISGMIQAAEDNVVRTTDKTIVICGHGQVANRAQLIAYRDMLVTVEGAVRELKTQGLGIEEIVSRKPTKAFDAKWGNFVIGPDLFTRLVYKGIV